jgi:creatinine amidohydrolase
VAVHLADLTWPEVPTSSLLVVPTGSCEQHGPHLPMDTDARIAAHLVELATEQLALDPDAGPLVIAPTLRIGASGEHQSFPGTLSIGTDALEIVVVELCRSALPRPIPRPPDASAPAPFDAVLFVNGHGGNIEAFGRAIALLSAEGRDVQVWHPRVPDGDSHAGATETSMLLHLDPGCVRMERAEPGSTARWREIGPTVVADGLAAVSPTGVLGDPTTATAEQGRRIVDALVDDLCSTVRSWRKG